MPEKDPAGFLDHLKLQALTMQTGQAIAWAQSVGINAGKVIKDGCVLPPVEKMSRKARVARWRQLYPVREMVLSVTAELRHAAARLEAEWERTEEGLCGLSEAHRRAP
ncbi:MAG: hypothetical protein Q8R35_02370 [bacterium]|nr:hypothetical protein [bacterium]